MTSTRTGNGSRKSPAKPNKVAKTSVPAVYATPASAATPDTPNKGERGTRFPTKHAAFTEVPMATSQQIKENPDVPAAPSPRQKAGAETRKKGRPTKRADKPVGLDGPPTTSKSATVMTMLNSDVGATLEAMQKATSRQAHSVRGFLSGTVKKRMALSLVSERGDDGARRYRIADAAASAAAKA